MAQPVIYRTPPLAGRPPYATDEPDSVYQQHPTETRRIRQQPPSNPNDRTSAYNMYDQYLDGSGRVPPAENPFDDSKRVPQQPIPLAAPKPGYAAPVAALNLSRPPRAATPEGKQHIPAPAPAMSMSPEMSQAFPKPLTLVSRQNSPVSPHFPHSPLELQAPMTPIAPAFIRPSSAASTRRDVKFSPTQPILRGDKEETLLPRRGQGEDFWRRFSMVAKEDHNARGSKSAWLRKTMNGSSRYSRWVWVIGIFLLLIIIAAIGFGVYKSQHDSNSDSSVVTAIGGSADEGVTTSSAVAGASTYLHVSPTLTLKDRGILDDVVPTLVSLPPVPIHVPPESGDIAHIARHSVRHRRSLVNRTLE
ncbi:uncharacterized protein FIBRA_00411 [Fibroporia radiculosa]|uniref:Uncharacterized protein n=1 Tax=Fibroporia radiculosa TaxID=599839 RepID=J4GZY4_9APHY|nr:uncharacterized protein FIBRA_00411 [Fibroporia radiculosa]CCL98414.1 predicted protein [Fibroporia radiculosa]